MADKNEKLGLPTSMPGEVVVKAIEIAAGYANPDEARTSAQMAASVGERAHLLLTKIYFPDRAP